jgi:hypothetical protein
MGEAATEGAAQTDRVVRYVPDYINKQGAGRPGDGRSVKCSMAYAGRDREHVVIDCQSIEAGDIVDIDQMRGPRDAERHHRHQALAARQNPPVKRTKFRELGHRLIDGFWRVICKLRGLQGMISRQVETS